MIVVLQHTCSTILIYDLGLQQTAEHKFTIQFHTSTAKDFKKHVFFTNAGHSLKHSQLLSTFLKNFTLMIFIYLGTPSILFYCPVLLGSLWRCLGVLRSEVLLGVVGSVGRLEVGRLLRCC